MGAGTSIFMIAVGAILDFAVKIQNTSGFNLNKIGLILMIVGIIGLILSLFFWNSWGGVGSFHRTSVSSEPRTSGVAGAGRPVVDDRVDYIEESGRY